MPKRRLFSTGREEATKTPAELALAPPDRFPTITAQIPADWPAINIAQVEADASLPAPHTWSTDDVYSLRAHERANHRVRAWKREKKTQRRTFLLSMPEQRNASRSVITDDGDTFTLVTMVNPQRQNERDMNRRQRDLKARDRNERAPHTGWNAFAGLDWRDPRVQDLGTFVNRGDAEGLSAAAVYLRSLQRQGL